MQFDPPHPSPPLTRRLIPLAAVVLLALPALLLSGGCGGEPESLDDIVAAEDKRLDEGGVLTEALQSDSPERRARAALALGRLQSRVHADALARLVDDPDRSVQLAALFALGQLGLAQTGGQPPPVAAQAAARVLQRDTDPEVLTAAIAALGKLALPGTAEALTPYLAHPSSIVRFSAALALFRARYAPVWRGESDEPPALPEATVEALIATLADSSPEVRWAAAYAFARWGDPTAVPDLARTFGDPNEWTRLFAVRAIGRSGAEAATLEALDGLARLARQDQSPRVRSEAVAALAALGAAERLTAEVAKDASFHVRAAYCRALGTISAEQDGEPGRGAEIDLLRRLSLDDPSPTVQAAAVGALARRLGDGYREELAVHLRNDDWRLRAAAVRAASGLPQARDLVLAAWDDGDVRVRVAALETSAEIAPAGADDWESAHLELLRRALADDDLAVRGTAVTLLGTLADARQQVGQPDGAAGGSTDGAADGAAGGATQPPAGWPTGEAEELIELLDAAYRASEGVDGIEVREGVVATLAQLPGSDGRLRSAATEDPAASVRDRARRALAERGEEPPASIGGGGDDAASPFLAASFESDPTVVLDTSKGSISIRCLSTDAPLTVASFVDLVGKGYYDGLLWHRVVTNFVIQGGDPRGDGWGGAGYTLRDEINYARFVRGAVGLPKAGKDTGGSQLFITHIPTPHLDGNYTVFGLVVEGLETVDRLEVGDTIKRAYVQR